MKRLLIVVLVLVVLAGVGWFILRQYLRSAHVTQQVVARIENLYGAQVKISAVDVGVGGTSLNDFRLYESDSEPEETPWLKVASLKTDLTLWRLARGATNPQLVEVQEATVLLRFNRNGELITRFPDKVGTAEGAGEGDIAEVPRVTIERSLLILRKEGHEDVVVSDVTATLTPEKDRLVLDGSGHHPAAGKILLNGTYELASKQAKADLKTERPARVTQSLLESLPLVPASVWSELKVQEAVSPATVKIGFDLDGKKLSYRVELPFRDAKVLLPGADLRASAVSGKVIIEDNLVTLNDVQGQTLGGTMRAQATLDFRDAVTRLDSKVEVDNLDVARVPREWNIPAILRNQVKGKLFGTAAISVTIRPRMTSPAAASVLVGLADPWLSGSGLLVAAPLGILGQHEFIIHGHGKGEVRHLSGTQQPAQFDWQIGPPRSEQPKAARQPSPGQSSRTWLAGVLAYSMLLLPGAEAQPAQGKQGDQANYFNLNLKMQDIDLAEFAQNLKLKETLPVQGKLSFQVKASIPLDKPGDLKAYRVSGSAQVKDFMLADLQMTEASAALDFSEGVLKLSSFTGRFAAPPGKEQSAGSFTGIGRMQVEPLGDVSFELTLDNIPLEQFTGFAGDRDLVHGKFSGKITAQASAKKLADVAAWDVTGTMATDRLSSQGVVFSKASAAVRLKDGKLELTKLDGLFEGSPVSATASMQIKGEYPFQASVDFRQWDLASLMKLAAAAKQKLPVSIAGKLSTTVTVKGGLKPLTVAASGETQAENLQVDRLNIAQVRFRWAVDQQKLDIKDALVKFYGGEATGTALLPLDAKTSGSLDLTLHHVDARQLAKALSVPFPIEGAIDGKLKGTIVPQAKGMDPAATLSVSLQAPKLRVQNIPTQQLEGKLEYREGSVDYKLLGKTLGGSFELEGQIPSILGPTPKAPAPKEPKQSRLRLKGIDLARLVEALNLEKAAPLSGTLNAEAKFSMFGLPRAAQDIQGSGYIRLTELGWQGKSLASTLQGDLALSAGQLRLRDFTGTVAGGRLQGDAAFEFADPERSWFRISLDSAQAAQLLQPWAGDAVRGLMHIHVRGALGAVWNGSADVTLASAQAFGSTVTQLRVPLTFQFSPVQNRGQIAIADASGQLASGRAVGKLTLAWDYTSRLEGEVRFINMDLQNLIRPFAGSTEVVGGRMNGRMTLRGTEVRSADDLQGAFEATFSQAQALQLPVLRQVAPYLGVGSQTTFQKGEVAARLDRGVIRLQRLSLEGTNLEFFAEGTLKLVGPINLDVMARTSTLGLPTQRLRWLGMRVPLAGPVPLGLLQEVSNLVSNRVIYLEVTGTVRSPIIRPRPLPILSQEAARYFLNRFGPQVPLGGTVAP